MRLLRLLLPATFVAVLLCASGRAAVQTVTLSLNQTNLPETCAALSQATGRSIRIGSVPIFPGQKPRDETLKRVTFNWNQATLSSALREVCDRFDLNAGAGPGGSIFLYPPWELNPGAVPPPTLELAATERQGLRFWIGSVDLRTKRSLALAAAGGAAAEGSLSLTIVCRSKSLDREKVAGLENVIAKDDQGTVLTGEVQSFRSPSFSGIPDEFMFSVTFPAPHPRATRLVWLEGDLGIYDELRHIDLELPPSKGRAANGLISVEVLSLNLGKAFETEANAQEGGPELRAKISIPPGVEIGTQGLENDSGMWPALIDDKDTSHFAFSLSGSGVSTTWGFPRVSAPVKSIRFPLVQKLSPYLFSRMTMRDIPLPSNAASVAAQPPVPFPATDADPKALRRLPIPPLSPTKGKGAKSFVREGVQVSLQSIWQTDTRVRRYMRPTEESLRQSLDLILEIDSGNLDPGHLAGASNVRITDNKGRIAAMTYPLIEDVPFRAAETLSQHDVTVSIPYAPQESLSLKTVEGDLMVFRDVDPVRFEFPSGVGSVPTRKQAGEANAELSGNLPHEGGKNLHVQLKVTYPQEIRMERPKGELLEVVGRSGKRYRPTSGSGTFERSGMPVVSLDAEFREIPESIDRVEVNLIRRSGLFRLYHFQIGDVPLPPEPAFRRLPVQKPGQANNESRALFDPQGGALAFSVRIADSPAPEGLLQVALSAEGNGPIRRLEARVDDHGNARLDSVKPGNYRLLLSYFPDMPPATAPKGRWLGSESTAVVQQGKTVRVPPLRWAKM